MQGLYSLARHGRDQLQGDSWLCGSKMCGNRANPRHLGGGIQPEDNLPDEMGLQARGLTDHGCCGLQGVLGLRAVPPRGA
jgi:hypothetical protein